MSTQEEPDIAEVADTIFNYLSDHTDKVDSVEAIAHWLKQQGYSIDLKNIRRALEYLEAVGLVIESPGRRGKTLYKSAYTSSGEM